MAKLETVYLEGESLKIKIFMRPGAETWIKIPLPEKFADCIWKLAQAAADKKEQEMRAEILGDQHAA